MLALLHQLWPEKVIHHDGLREALSKYIATPNYWIYGYEAEGTLRGIITESFRWSLFYEGEAAIIEDLVVDEAYRGEGIGGTLVSFAEEKIIADGRAKAVEVNSDLHRVDTHYFWQERGYSKLAFQLRKGMR
ncbi:MAG: GNAT family N-acetyltransferase [Anaerolineae bacterium]|nr:GNAT family N-acetyltransferase [Anaerolineae bacterium]NIN95111.1 GNAT family N-acetyltransferase [Anaerolineae bacterium]NIQ78963.1 GNAT family N-acetyltransferase [Anaerolineae bacterium]